MHKTATFTWIIFIVLTIASALISTLEGTSVELLLLILSALKFFGIAFQFMELKKANLFWKGLIIGFILIFATILFVTIQ